jgi:hypothetical protein
VSLTDRDRKILIVLVALAVVGAYWFLLLSPKRDEASKASKQLTEQRDRRTQALGHVAQLSGARTNYAAEYADLLRIGKAVPASVDMPSLLVQLDQASKGTNVDFESVEVGQRQSAASSSSGSSPPAPGSSSGGSTSSASSSSSGSSGASSGASQSPGGLGKVPAGAGGQKAGSLPGRSAEQAGNRVQQANAANKAASQNGMSPQDTQTSQSSKSGGLAVGGGAGSANQATAGSGGSGVPGLDTVPLTFKFTGTYFELADFYHQLKRFVFLRRNAIQVKGRLLTIDGFKFSNGASAGPGSAAGFGKLSADVSATVYLVPKQQGVTAGASPQGPAGSGTQAVGTGGATPQAPVPAPTAAAKP